MELHHLFQDYTSSGRGAKTKLFKLQQIDAINIKNVQDVIHVPSLCILKGKKLGTCGLEGIKGPPTEPPEVGLELVTWLGLLNLTSWESKSQLQLYDLLLIHAPITLIKLNPRNPNI